MKETLIFDPRDWEAFTGCIARFDAARDVASGYVVGDSDGYPEKMSAEQRAASLALTQMNVAFYELKDHAYYMLKCQPDSTYHMNITLDALSAGDAEYCKPEWKEEKMAFEKLDTSKESMLKEYIEETSTSVDRYVGNVSVSDGIRALRDGGYIENLIVEGDGRCSFFLTRKGLGYFDAKKANEDLPGPWV